MSLEDTDNRAQFSLDDVDSVLNEIREKVIYRLKQKGWGISVSRHEIYGLLAEEFKELLDALQGHGNEARAEFHDELLDIGVGVVHALCSLKSGKMDW